MSGYFCWNCGCPGPGGTHYCSHCRDEHHFITAEQIVTIRYDYKFGDNQMPEPDIDAELKPEHFQIEYIPDEPEAVAVIDNSSTLEVPQFTRDKQHKYFDYTCGAEITSRSQKRRIYEQQGLVEVSAKDEYRDKEKPNTKGRAVTYGGQKNHKSTAERGGVRTKTGQQVI